MEIEGLAHFFELQELLNKTVILLLEVILSGKFNDNFEPISLQSDVLVTYSLYRGHIALLIS